MSRKALFANLNKPEEAVPETHVGQQPEGSAQTNATNTDLVRTARSRARPILGSPELVKDPSSAPVGALGRSLSEFKAKTEHATEIERKLAAGQTVVDLDPTLIDPSFVTDRMPSAPETETSLVSAIREHGQHVPILVRPHPTEAGRYQVAYGHRRVRAAIELKRPVRAVVRNLVDEELVIAQGQENNEREGLSFIERSRFARRLEERGFRRETIMTALSVHKSDLSNMLSVVSRIPGDIVEAIGPAPGIGRRGWIDIADHLSDKAVAEAIRALALSPEVRALESDQRFRRVYSSIKPRTATTRSHTWVTPDGAKFAKIVQNADKVSVTINRRIVPDFSDFILERLQSLYDEFKSRH